MKFIPAIDLINNKCVRLEKGKEKDLTIFNHNPIDQAKFFEKNGCDRIHIVDLDGAFGRANVNKETILEIRKKTNVLIELGGGIKNNDNFSFWINKGIDFIVVGSLAVKNEKLILDMAEKYENKIYVALDVLIEKVMIKGWTEDSQLTIKDILKTYNNSLINGFILTDISRDGMLKGLDMKFINNFITRTKKNIIVGGGLKNYKDLHNLKKINYSNLEGVIAGKAFYSGNIKIDKALQIIDTNA